MHLNNVGGSADGGSVDSVDHGGRVVGLPVGEDPSVGTLEDDGQAPPDVAEGLVLRLTRLPGFKIDNNQFWSLREPTDKIEPSYNINKI